MEIICTVDKVLPMEQREYTDQNGQRKNIISRGIILNLGFGNFYAELFGENALKFSDNAPSGLCCARIGLSARPWRDNNGKERWENRITLYELKAF